MKSFRKISIILLIIVSLAVNTFIGVTALADEGEIVEYGTGLDRLSQEEQAAFLASLPEIKEVRLNKNAISRINSQLVFTAGDSDDGYYDENLGVNFGNETVIVNDNISTYTSSDDWSREAVSHCSFIDNSTEKFFPKIGNQGTYNTCVVWAMAYYQLTNNNALIRDYDAKSSYEHVMDPIWIYNLINNGGNNYVHWDRAMTIMRELGAVTWKDRYGSGLSASTDFKSWNPGYSIWENAIKNKTEDFEFLYVYDYNDIENIKKILLNGYVVTFGTDCATGLSNWKCKIGTAGGLSNQYICYNVTTYEGIGAHTMTIVGYDDNAWVDANGNGIKDIGETGAFKIANSWGSSFRNNGYIWLTYDAIFDKTSIPNINPGTRTAAFMDNCIYHIKPYISENGYDPLVIADVELNTARRNQIDIFIGASDVTRNTPEISMEIVRDPFSDTGKIAFYQGGGAYNFTGGTTATNGQFAFDFTPVIEQYYALHPDSLKGNFTLRLYLTVKDSINDSYSTKINMFNLKDVTNDANSSSKVSLPLISNGNSVTAYADINIESIVSDNSSKIYADFNYPIQSRTVNSSNISLLDKKDNAIQLSFSQSDDRKTINIEKLDGSFKNNTYYTLNISNDLMTDGGNMLGQNVSKKIYFIKRNMR